MKISEKKVYYQKEKPGGKSDNGTFEMKITERKVYNPKEKPGGKLYEEAPRIVQFSWKW